MIIPIIIASLLITGTGVPVYEYEAEKHSLPKIPFMPDIIGSAQNALQGGKYIFSGGGGGSSSQASQSSLQTNTQQSSPQASSAVFSNQIPDSSLAQTADPNIPPTFTPKVIVNPQLSQIALCGKEQTVYSYDKTDMKTGGDIHFFIANAPNENLTIKLDNDTTISSLKNQNVSGCFVAYNLPNNMELNLIFTGDFNGTMRTMSGIGTENTVTCSPAWQESVQYDNFGNVLQTFDPPILHQASCGLQ